MIWRIGTQFLVQREEVFALVDPTGSVVRRFAPHVSSLEDELYRTHWKVTHGELREQTTVERFGDAPRISFAIALSGLVADPTADTARFIATALGDDAVVEEERRLRVLGDAEARIVAVDVQIDGARADLARGPHVARAQAALRRRVYEWGDDHAAGLLVTLIALARADVRAHVLVAFANGCLDACFEADVPGFVDGPIVPHPILAARCAAHARTFAREAEAQSWIDAHANASAYDRAQVAFAVAAELLGYCSTTGD